MGRRRRDAFRISAILTTLADAIRSARDQLRLRRRRRPPPDAGVREPRRPRPTLPAAAIALAEPRTDVRRWIKLINRRDDDLT